MGPTLSAMKQRKLRRQQRKKIFCAEKHNRNVLLLEIPKKCRMVIMKEMNKEFRSLYPYVKARGMIRLSMSKEFPRRARCHYEEDEQTAAKPLG